VLADQTTIAACFRDGQGEQKVRRLSAAWVLKRCPMTIAPIIEIL
jgi:hypothetical protein